MPSVPNNQASGQSNGSQDSGAQSENSGVTLQEIQADIRKIHTTLETEFGTSPALAFIKQKLKEAASAVDQELRNITIDAQMAERKAERKAAAAAKNL